MAEGAGVDFRLIKALFSQILPPDDSLRIAAEDEENWMSTKEGLPKLTVYYRFWAERKRREGGGLA